MENSIEVPQNIKNGTTTLRSINSILGYKGNENGSLKRYMYAHFH